MSWWHPGSWRRRPVSTVAAVVTVPAIVLTLALVDRGFPLARVDLNDGGVWLTATSQLSLGRYNVPVEELDGGLVTESGDFDVLQDEGAVLLVEPTTVSVVDPASVATTTRVATGGADVSMAAGRAAFVDDAGDVWVRDLASLDGLDLTADAPDLQLGEGGAAVVARSGAVLAVAPEDGTVTRVPATSPVAPEEAGTLGALEVDAVTAVGDELVVLSGSTVRTTRGEVTVDDEDLVLQQPGPAASTVLLSSRDALWEVPLDGGTPRRHETTGSGTPAAPVRVGECAQGAWASSLGSSLILCQGRDAQVEDLEGMTSGDRLAFRVNRGLVVLNDTVAGRVWLPQQDTQVRVPNWQDIVPEDEPQDSEEESESGEVTQEPVTECSDQSAPPVAVDDEFGVRAGRSRILPVIDNDSSSDCGILVISQVGALPAEFGTVEAVRGGRALQVRVLEGATGSAEFEYVVNDGRGVNAPAAATVRLTVSQGDQAPVQVRTSSLTVETGGRVEHGVLADFEDADGDDLLLVGATADVTVGSVRFRQDGVLTYTADGGGLGRTTIQVQVSDGTNVVDGEVVVDVRAAGSVPPQIDPVHAVTYVGQEVVVRPLDAVRSASSEPARLASVSDTVGATITPDLSGGTFGFRAARAGVYYVPFVVTAAPQQATGIARIDVREWPEQAQPPIAVRDIALLPAGGSVTIDPLANDEDPADNVLVLQSVSTPEDSGLQVAVLDRRYVQIRAERTPDRPVLLGYEVSNGTASARGEIVVQPIPPSASSQPPFVPNVEATVRAGGVVTIPVLEGASDPDGDALTVLRELPEPLAQGDGLLFVSGDVLRYQAPDRALTARATFAVADTAGNVTAATVTVRVHESDAATKSPPRPRDLVARVFEGDTVRIPVPLVGIDDDGDGVTLLGPAAVPTLGVVTEVGADWIEYEALPGSRGTDTFTYAVEDWVGQRAVATVRVGIAPRPTTGSGVVAVDDAVTLRPGQRVEVRVLANDIDSTGRELTLESIEAPDGVQAEIQGRRIVVTAPSTPGVVPIVYLVSNDVGGSDYGTLTVTVTDDAPVEPPVARDVVVPAIDTLGKTEVAVDVLAVAQNPSGPLSDLEVSVPASHADVARIAPDGQVVVTLVDHAQTVPYRLVNRTAPEADAYAFITVPALGFFPPQLRPRAPELRVASGETLTIPLAEHVQVAPGREPSIADPTQVSATRSNGAELVQDVRTLVFTSAEGYAGPASISVPVTDATGASDTTARTTLLTLQITVYAVDDHPPTFQPETLEVAPGEAPTRIDLHNLTTGPEQSSGSTADRYGYRLVSGVPAGFSAMLEGSELRVSADATTPKGTTGRLDMQLTYGRSGVMDVGVDLKVIASSRLRATVRDFVVDDAVQGKESTVQVLEGSSNPFPERGPLTVVGAVVETAGAGTASASSSSVSVRPNADFIGNMTVRYRVRDVTGDPSREVEGRISVRVSGVPAAPVPPRIGEVRDRTVVLSWTAPDNRNEQITEYRVTAQPGSVVKTCASTTCTIDGLTNDVEYTFTVAAKNRVGWSEESPRSAPARPDTVPDAPTGLVLQFGDGSIRASWQPARSSGSPVKGYEVWLFGDRTNVTQLEPSTSRTFSGLTNGSSYQVRVRAVNSQTEPGPWSDTATMIPAGPPGAPPELSAARVDTPLGGQINVSWGEAEPNGRPVRNYLLTIRGSGGGEGIVVSPSERSFAFRQARNGEEYTFEVRAESEAGTSAASKVTASTYGLPGVPGTPTAKALTGQGSVRLSWGPADPNGSAVQSYLVSISGEGELTRVVDAGAGLSTEISNLAGGRSYTFSVTARNAQGEGGASGTATAVPSVSPGQPVVAAPEVASTGPASRPATLRVRWEAASAGSAEPVTYHYVVRGPGGDAEGSTQGTEAVIDVGTWRFSPLGSQVTVEVVARTVVDGQTLQSGTASSSASIGRWGNPPGAPGAVGLVADDLVDPRLLTGSWSPPSDGGVAISGYSVRWIITRSGGGSETFVFRIDDASANQDARRTSDLGGLGPGDSVAFSVQARNFADGPWSSSAVLTVPRAPEPTPDPPAPGGDG